MARQPALPSRILSYLQNNPLANRKNIAADLKVSYQAVQKCIQKLKSNGEVSEGFIVFKHQIKKTVSILDMDQDVLSSRKH